MDDELKQGRPHIDKGQESALERYDVRLSFRQARIVRKIGAGNLSEGIRICIEKAAADFEFMNSLPPLKK